jgi:hypothetical protein
MVVDVARRRQIWVAREGLDWGSPMTRECTTGWSRKVTGSTDVWPHERKLAPKWVQGPDICRVGRRYRGRPHECDELVNAVDDGSFPS